MTESHANTETAVEHDVERPIAATIDERFDVEAIAHFVEQLDFSKKLSSRLRSAFRDVRSQTANNHNALEGIRYELRQLIMDVALLKRAVTSLGQVGVMERRKIEKELLRELFPPHEPRSGVGLIVTRRHNTSPTQVDCESRLPLCKAACCRIFNVGLTPHEVQQDLLDWDERRPYALRKNRLGCIHLKEGCYSCSIYGTRPQSCQSYTCVDDRRIWADFDKRILNPELQTRLAELDPRVEAPHRKHSPDAQLAASARQTEMHSEKVRGIDYPRETLTRRETGQSGSMLETTSADAIAGDQDSKDTNDCASAPDFDALRELGLVLPERQFTPPTATSTRQRQDSD